MFVFKIIILFCALLLPTICGYPFVCMMSEDEGNRKFERFILSFLTGWMLFFAIFAVAGFADFGFSLSGGIVILCIIWGVGVVLNSRSELKCVEKMVSDGERVDKWRRVTGSLLTLFIVLTFLLLFIASSSEWDSFAMTGVWGYKAKLFYSEGYIPISFFVDSKLVFTHQSYPLLYPVMLTWLYFSMGGVYDIALKLMPPLLGVFICLSIYNISLREGCTRLISLMLALTYCGGATFFLTSTTLYAENLLILYELWGIYLLFDFIRRGGDRRISGRWHGGTLLPILLLGAGACVKNEGALYFVLAGLYFLISFFYRCCFGKESLRNRIIRNPHTSTLLQLFMLGIIIILPWQLFRYFLNIRLVDFDVISKLHLIENKGFFESGCCDMFKLSLSRFVRAMFVNLNETCGIWYFLIFALIALKKRIFTKEILFLLLMICVPIILFLLSFIFSIRPIKWHLDAVPRLLLVPAISALVIISALLSRRSNKE